MKYKMNVLDLFSGLKGWSQAFADRGHNVTSVDIDIKFKPSFHIDIMDIKDITDLGNFDIILASPPCNCFSVASIGKHWAANYKPKDAETYLAIKLVKHTLNLLEKSDSFFWVLENPMGVLRKLDIMKDYDHKLVTYCQYGEHRMKPTDLWGKFPPSFVAKSCKNGMDCHDRTPRGSKTGTQGLKDSATRAKIPYGLSLAMCLAMENDMP
jgi:hypothetical protein